MHGRHYPSNDAGQPDLCVVTIQVLPRVCERDLIVGCAEFDMVIQVTFDIKNVCSVLLQCILHLPSHPMHVTE